MSENRAGKELNSNREQTYKMAFFNTDAAYTIASGSPGAKFM